MGREVGAIVFFVGFALFMLAVILYQDLEEWYGIFETLSSWFGSWSECPDTGGCAEVEKS